MESEYIQSCICFQHMPDRFFHSNQALLLILVIANSQNKKCYKLAKAPSRFLTLKLMRLAR